ncbi:MAG TPA: DUF3800 domain-containing protein [Candidatus Acidoferrales bacterium]|nr:DUF3800 domain-containing protein [Candidatus Acidoferrales bacterium]
MATVTSNPKFLPGLTRYISFVDEAGHAEDPKQHFLCLAGLLAKEAAWRKLEIEWVEACADAGLVKPFHMKHLAGPRGEFKGWPEAKRQALLGPLVKAIEDAGVIPIGSVVSLDWYRSLSPTHQVEVKDPHFLAFQALTYQIAAAASIQLEMGPVTMVYAHHPEHSNGLANTHDLWDAVRKYNPIVGFFMQSYVPGEPAEQPGLQAADLWAYELRHHFEVIRPAQKTPRWPFQQFVKLGLNYDFPNDFITYHDEHGHTGLGQMSRVQRWGEIDLYKPGFVGLHPTNARQLDAYLRSLANPIRAQGKSKASEYPSDSL